MNKEEVFYFKKFEVRHNASSMKVGTDAVLLGAWADVSNCDQILDIGTGCGVIALMLAQRSEEKVFIDALDIDQPSCDESKSNFDASPWSKRLSVICNSIQNYQQKKYYDLIVSNPPFFSNSFKPESATRMQARHTTHLDVLTLISSVKQLLKSSGRFAAVLPFAEGLEFVSVCERHELCCSRKCAVRSRAHKPVERWLMEFQYLKTESRQEEIIIHDLGDQWDTSYKELTKDFYLKN